MFSPVGKKWRREHTELSIQHQQVVENYIMLINSLDEETTTLVSHHISFELSTKELDVFGVLMKYWHGRAVKSYISKLNIAEQRSKSS